MDDLDRNLIDAFWRVWKQCEDDPDEARRRWERSRRVSYQRVPAAWCLRLRAGDRRITRDYGLESDEADRVPHEVEIDGAAIRDYCRPIELPYPGLPLDRAAARLGRHPESLRKWLPIRPGRTRAARAQRVAKWDLHRGGAKVFSVRYEPPAAHGRRGMLVPVVWTQRPLDPGADLGATPHPVWGSSWRLLHERIPEHYAVVAERVPDFRDYPRPRPRPRKGSGGVTDYERRFRGWLWKCPGRWVRLAALEAAGVAAAETCEDEHGVAWGLKPCGRRCKQLVGPLPVPTVAEWLGVEGVEVDRGDAEGPHHWASGGVTPGVGTPRALALRGGWVPTGPAGLKGPKGFACQVCWDMRAFSLCDGTWWNELVTYLSGGLLYGHEVERPAWVRYERKQTRRRKAACPRGAGAQDKARAG